MLGGIWESIQTIPSKLPERPWQKVATDLFDWKGQEFILVVNYFSRYCEIGVLRKLTSQEVISPLKAIFARHGIPETVIPDNRPQYSSAEFSKFAQEWGFSHVTSSPKYPQRNREVERTVQTIKNFLTKAEDPHEALLAYRATPLENGFSPAELRMGRRLRTTLPTIGSLSKSLRLALIRLPEENVSQNETLRMYVGCIHP